MQAFSAEQPLPQQPQPVFPRYGTRGRSLEEMRESVQRNLNGPRLLEEMRESAQRSFTGSRSLEEMQENARRMRGSLEEMQESEKREAHEKRQAAAALGWASAVRLSDPHVLVSCAWRVRANRAPADLQHPL
jgi:hypothetical protein